MSAVKEYKDFGPMLVKLREQAGIAHQSALAARVNVTQQTISRWEAGDSRPRQKQLSALASALNVPVDQLLAAAGYTSAPVTVSFDQPFPLDSLTAESFERFCFHFLDALYPGAQVHRAGKSGDAQHGIDIMVKSQTGVFTFQCKRVQNFGPQHVLSAVAAHTVKADQKVILLSRIASPKAREAAQLHAGWDIWDKEDISLKIHKLPKEAIRRLVDIFFPTQRFALLGQGESGSWQTTDEFFAPFASGKGMFRHTWNLVGRIDKKQQLVNELLNDECRLVFLVGPGGVGKTRLLKEAINEFEAARRSDTIVRFLAPAATLTPKSLGEDFGTGKKLMIIDDAHDRTDWQILFQHASVSSNTRVLLSFRPYWLDHIKSQAASFGLTVDMIRHVELDRLNVADATELAKQVLTEFGGPIDQAEYIGRITRDCPLATVIGCEIVSQRGVHLEFAKNEDAFRSTLLGRFKDIIAGTIGNRSNADSIKKLLRITALLQPFHFDDATFAEIVEKVERLPQYETRRLIRVLTDAGVLFKRGAEMRLSPDMLADYLIEEACLGEAGTSTGYAEHVFDSATPPQIENLVLSLGKLDWRRSNGDPTNSRLLDGIWSKLIRESKDSANHLRTVTEVAFYQPARALDFAEKLIRNGTHLRSLPTLLRYVAYSLPHLPRACECLWGLGKPDNDQLNQRPDHGIRILSELCAAEPNKPIQYNEVVVDFGLSLVGRPESWLHKYTPFDFLKGILQTEGHSTKSSGLNLTLTPFTVRHKAVAELRRKVIGSAIAMLSHESTRIAVLSARFLHDALRYPIQGAGDETRDALTREFAETLKAIQKKIEESTLHAVVLVEILSSVSWHANYAGGETGSLAINVINSMPQNIQFRTTRAFVDGYGHLLKFESAQELEQRWNSYNQSVISDLLLQFRDGESLRATLEHYLAEIELNYGDKIIVPSVLYSQLVQSSLPLARATVEDALLRADSKTMRFAGIALAKLFKEERPFATKTARQFLASERSGLQAAVGEGYLPSETIPLVSEEERNLLREILTSKDPFVVRSGTHALRMIERKSISVAIELLKSTNLGISHSVADDFLMIFYGSESNMFASLSKSDMDEILQKLLSLPELEGFWIERFLATAAKLHPLSTLEFFIKRVEYAAANKDWACRPCNYGPYVHTPLQFRESGQLPTIFHRVSKWIESRPIEDSVFHHFASKLFESIFQPFDDELVVLLQSWIDSASSGGLRIISKLLDEASEDFIFEQSLFVSRLLERCKQLGPDYLKLAINALYSSAVMGPFSGTPGEPFPRDLDMKKKAEAILKDTPPFSAAFELYDEVRKRAEDNIRMALQERVAFEG
ncbi:MAG: helix-turn-helix domain-containing protein [Terriglobales bacterium]